jgi:DNA-binding transcriptional LysR family regulator
MAYRSEVALAELVAFVAVVDHHGFSAAARAAGLRKATLSERVRDLEARLGATLLVRTTRTLSLTDEGRAYADHARRALAAAREAEAAAIAMRATPSGKLRITMTPALAALFLDGVIAPYMRSHPNVSVELDTSMRNVDVVREGFDLAIRVGRLADSTLVARRLGTARGGYYASPAYLARRGAPTRPEELADHDTVAIPRGDRMPTWTFTSGHRKRSVVVRPRLFVGAFELAIPAALAGIGIIPNLRHHVQPYLAREELVPVLPEWTRPAIEVNALFAPGNARLPKLRAMIDRFAAWFAERGGKV